MITYRANPSFGGFYSRSPFFRNPGSYSSNPTILDYSLKPMKNALGFQVHAQHPMLTEFLRNNKFRASNGIIVDISVKPEIVESMKDGDFIIYLRGSNSKYDTKVDITRFVGSLQRDGHKGAINTALKELVQHVKNSVSFRYPRPAWEPLVNEVNCVCW